MKNSVTYFDSREEEDFFAWLVDAMRYEMIKSFVYQPTRFVLSEPVTIPAIKHLKTKTKLVSKHLLREHVYTPDFLIWPRRPLNALRIKWTPHVCEDMGKVIYLDVKGTWTPVTKAQEFSMNQKWMYQRYGIYVNKVIPIKLFQKTWCPKQAALTKTGKPRKHFNECRNKPTNT